MVVLDLNVGRQRVAELLQDIGGRRGRIVDMFDPDTTDQRPVFNRTVSLRDTWAKIQKSQQR